MTYVRKKSKYADGSKPVFWYDTKEMIQIMNQVFRDYGGYMRAQDKVTEKDMGTYKESGAAGYKAFNEVTNRIKKLKKLK